MNHEFVKTRELLKKQAEIKNRQQTNTEAIARARERIAAREQFIPKSGAPVRNAVMGLDLLLTDF